MDDEQFGAILKAAVASRDPNDYERAAQAHLERQLGGDWAEPPFRASVFWSFARLMARATARDTDAVAAYVVHGHFPLPEDRHHAFMRGGIVDHLPAVIVEGRDGSMNKAEKTLHALLMMFAATEAAIRPGLGLTVAVCSAALGKPRLAADILLETEGQQRGKIRSLGSMLQLFSQAVAEVQRDREVGHLAPPLRALHVALVSLPRDLGPGIEVLRNIVGHMDFEVDESGNVSCAFNQHTRKAAITISHNDVQELLNEVTRLFMLFRAIGGFAFISLYPAPEG